MRAAFILLFLIFQNSCVPKRSEDANLLEVGRKKGTYKGYHSIQSILRTKVFTDAFGLASHAPGKDRGYSSDYIDGLATLLGEYEGVGTNNKPQQAIPNSTNVLVWYLTMSNVAESIFEHCKANVEENTSINQSFNTRFSKLNEQICQHALKKSPLPKAFAEAFWYSVMDFNTPKTEFEAWSRFADLHLKQSGIAGLKDVYLSMLVNPYFLLVN